MPCGETRGVPSFHSSVGAEDAPIPLAQGIQKRFDQIDLTQRANYPSTLSFDRRSAVEAVSCRTLKPSNRRQGRFSFATPESHQVSIAFDVAPPPPHPPVASARRAITVVFLFFACEGLSVRTSPLLFKTESFTFFAIIILPNHVGIKRVLPHLKYNATFFTKRVLWINRSMFSW